MLAPLSPSAKLRALADDIEQDTKHDFSMDNPDTCAYAFCKRRFGVWHDTVLDNEQHLANMLGISLEEATSIYNATDLGQNRRLVSTKLRTLALQLEGGKLPFGTRP